MDTYAYKWVLSPTKTHPGSPLHISIILFWLLVCIYFPFALEAEYVLLAILLLLSFDFTSGFLNCHKLTMTLSLPGCVNLANYVTLASWTRECSLWFLSCSDCQLGVLFWGSQHLNLLSGRGHLSGQYMPLTFSGLKDHVWMLGTCAALAKRAKTICP